MWLLSYPPLWINGHKVVEGTQITNAKYHVLQFKGPVYPRYKKELGSMGIRFYDYMPKYAFVVSGPVQSLREALKKPYVARIVPIKPEYKLPKFYKEKIKNGCYYTENGKYVARLVLASPDEANVVKKEILRRGLVIRGEDPSNPYIEISGSVEEIESFINYDEVLFVEFRHPITNWNNRKAVTHQAGYFFDVETSTNPLDTIVWMKGLHGEGEILGHNDDGLDKNHCFFSGNVLGQPKIVTLCDYGGGGCGVASLPPGTNCNTNPGTGCHGTHTAGTAVGGSDVTPASRYPYRGLAYMARLISQTPLGGGGAGFNTVLTDAYSRGARVHTNSWGYICGFFTTRCAPSDYNTDARTIDNFVWNNPDMVVVFAAGNHGDDGCNPGCSRTPSDPATAKSDITVGAMGRAVDAKMGWSAYGSFPSGRFGNDILAIGDTTYSAWGNTACGITTAWWWMGTSMATPATAGGAILIRQYYKEGWYGNGTRNSAPSHNPSAALVRASLLASALPVAHDNDVSFGNEFSAGNTNVPNGNEGAGRFVLDNFMYFSPEDQWNSLADSSDERKSRLWFVDNTTGLNTGDSVEYTVDICNPHMVTRFVLSWSDFRGSTNCASGGGCLVNDLDLTVIGPGGETFIGNAPTTGADNLTPNDNTIPHDRANTWELVRVKGLTGTFRIKVKGFNVPNGPQPFAVVVSGGLGPCPLGGDNELGVREIAVGSAKIRTLRDALVIKGENIKVRIYSAVGRKVSEIDVKGERKVRFDGKGVYMIAIYKNGKLEGVFKHIILR